MILLNILLVILLVFYQQMSPSLKLGNISGNFVDIHWFISCGWNIYVHEPKIDSLSNPMQGQPRIRMVKLTETLFHVYIFCN